MRFVQDEPATESAAPSTPSPTSGWLTLRVRQWIVWLIAPLVLLSVPFLIRFTILPGEWYFFANLSLTSIMIIYVWVSQNMGKLRGALILQIPITILSFLDILGGSYVRLGFVVSIREAMVADGGVRGAIGILHILIGAYVFKLGVRSVQRFDGDKNELVQSFRSILGLSAFFSLIVALGVFAIQSPYPVNWTIRPAILIAGIIVGVFGVSLGVVFGYGQNPLLLLVGVVLISGLAFILGTAIIPFTGAFSGTASSPTVFPAQVAFFSDTLLLTGVMSFLVSESGNPLNILVKKVLT